VPRRRRRRWATPVCAFPGAAVSRWTMASDLFKVGRPPVPRRTTMGESTPRTRSTRLQCRTSARCDTLFPRILCGAGAARGGVDEGRRHDVTSKARSPTIELLCAYPLGGHRNATLASGLFPAASSPPITDSTDERISHALVRSDVAGRCVRVVGGGSPTAPRGERRAALRAPATPRLYRPQRSSRRGRHLLGELEQWCF